MRNSFCCKLLRRPETVDQIALVYDDDDTMTRWHTVLDDLITAVLPILDANRFWSVVCGGDGLCLCGRPSLVETYSYSGHTIVENKIYK